VALLLLSGCSGGPEARKQRFFESGNSYFDEGDHRSAIIEYRNAVAIDPLFGEARAKLAESYTRIGDGPNAVAEYVRAADLLSQDFEVQLRAGELLLVAGQADQSLARADAALKLRPQNIAAHILRGNALAGLSSFDKALEAIEEAIRIDPGRGATFTQKGLIELASGRRQEAEAAFEKAVALAPDAVDGYLALGNYYWAVGRSQETERAFIAALKIQPDHIVANRAMAALALATGKAADAEQYLRRIADTSKDANSILALADYYLVAGRAQDAIGRLTPLVSTSGSPVPGAQQRLARAYAASGDRGKARDLVDKILAADKGNLDAQLLKGQLLLAEGQREEALVAVRDAVNAYPRSAEAQFLLGSMYAARGDSGAAETAFRQVLSINPRLAAAQVELAKLQLSTGQAAASLKSAEEAARNAPGNLSTRLTLVRSLLASKDVSRAEREISALRSQHPDLAEVNALAGVLAGLKNDPVAARAAFVRALAFDDSSIEALAGLIALDLRARDTAAAKSRIDSRVKGKASPELLLLAARTYASVNELGPSEAFLRQAIEADSTLLPAYAMLGQLYLSQKRLDEARKEFESLASRQLKPVAALTMSGIILQTQGNLPEARKRYTQVLEIDPRAAISANNLAWIQAESGDNLDMALQLAQTAAEAAPQLPAIADTLGWIYYKKKLPVLAIPQFLRSIEMAPDVPVYHYHLGLAYLLSGEVNRGQAALRKALALGPDSATSADIKRALDSALSTN
jgi:putative PEP-CTERM system TPR-repeat lipoprotein